MLRSKRLIALRMVRLGLAGLAAGVLERFDRPRGLELRGKIEVVRWRHSDHTGYWVDAEQAFPGDARFVRGKTEAALAAGHASIARSGLQWLVTRGLARYSDWKFVVGLGNIDQCSGDLPAARSRTGKYLRSLCGKKDYRLAALKLSRAIFAQFSRRGGPVLECSLRMLQRSPACGAPRAILERVAQCEMRLASSGSIMLPDTDVSQAVCRRVVALIRERLHGGRPFSLVRVGDGEAACLEYEPELRWLQRSDARDRERIWWGQALPAAQSRKLAAAIGRATWQADCIGIPTFARYLRELDLTREDALEDRLTGRGLRAILYNLERFDDLRTVPVPGIFTSCHLHQDLARWNLYGELFDGTKDVVLVSCHPELADCMKKRFAVNVAANIVVPADRVSGPRLASQDTASGLLPNILDEIADAVACAARNRLVLVGAGYPGKVLVDKAREGGGVALDVGSIFDFWLGYHTRSYLDLTPV